MSHLKYPGRLVKLLGLFVFLRNGSNNTVICEIWHCIGETAVLQTAASRIKKGAWGGGDGKRNWIVGRITVGTDTS